MLDPYRPLRGHTLVVHLSNGESFRGVVMDSRRRTLILEDAHALTGRGSAAIDGEFRVPHSNVVWYQRLYAIDPVAAGHRSLQAAAA